MVALLDLGWRSREPRTAPNTMIGAPTITAVINTPPCMNNDNHFGTIKFTILKSTPVNPAPYQVGGKSLRTADKRNQ